MSARPSWLASVLVIGQPLVVAFIDRDETIDHGALGADGPN
jgi:hypothetical protein